MIKKNPWIINYKYNYTDQYTKLHVMNESTKINESTNILHNAYFSTLPISTNKKKDLVTLCKRNIVPKELHPWFQKLKVKKNMVDKVTEPAVEDSEED